MFRRIWFSHPHRPSEHLLIALVAAIVAILVLLLDWQDSRGGGDSYLPDFLK